MTDAQTTEAAVTMGDFLSALLAATQDPIRLVYGDDDTPVDVGVDDSLSDALVEAGSEPVYLSPVTSTGQVPFLYTVTENETEEAWMDLIGVKPTVVLFKAGTMITAFALEVAAQVDDPAVVTLAEAMGGALADPLADPIPTPGANGWSVLHCDEAIYTAFADLDAAYGSEAPVVAQAAPAIADHGTLNDAKLLTPFDLGDPRYQQTMIHAFGANRESQKWISAPVPVSRFIDKLSNHPEDKKKDGAAFVLAEILGQQRKKAAVKACYGVGLDIDVGVSGAVIDAALVKLGCLAVRYTTHSHGKASTKLLKDRITKWLAKNGEDEVTEAGILRFLREESRWDASIIDTVEYVGDIQEPEGFMVDLRHAPMPKHRVVLPLATPFEPTTVAKTHDEGMKMWGQVCHALARALGDLPLDRSAVDPSRLFYFPRHPAKMPHETTIVGGDLLDWKTLDLDGAGVAAEAGSFEALLDAEVKASEKTKSKSTTDAGRKLGRWSIKAAGGFQIADVIRDYAEDRIRTPGSQKIDIECPFDEEHSDPGNAEDRGCFAVNAGDGPSDIFTVKCQHDSCSERTNLDHVGKMIADGWFEREVLDDPTYNALDEDAEPATPEAAKIASEDAARATYETLVEALTPDSTDKEVDDCLRAVIDAALPPRTYVLIEAKLKKALGMTQTQFGKVMRAAEAKAATDRAGKTVVDPDYPLPPHLESTRTLKRGSRLYLHKINDGGGGDEPLCTRFAIVGGGIYADRENARDVEVTIENEFGKREAIRLDAEGLGEKRKVIGLLRKKGMVFATETGETFAHRALMDYQPSNTVIRDRCGWLEDGSFMMPTGVYLGQGDVRLSDEKRIAAAPTAGTLDGWKAAAAVACKADSPSLHAGLLSGLAGPLTGLTGQATLIIAFTGQSTEGKSWRQQVGVAASGTPEPGVGQMKSMNSTEGALEMPLERGSCTTAAYDELHHAPAKVVQNLVFRASGQQGRARLKQTGAAGLTREWRGGVVTLSTETGLAQRLRQEGENLAGGATVRMIEVDVTTGRLPNEDWEKANAMLKNYGHALPVLIEEVRRQGYVDKPADLIKRVQAFVEKLDGVDTPMEMRAATAVGYLCVAGEIAQDAGLLPETFDLDQVGRVLWEGAMGGEMKAENPVDRSIDFLLETINTRRSEIWDETALRDPTREIMAWISTHGDNDEKVYCLRASMLGKWSGGAADERALKKALLDQGLAVPYSRTKTVGDKVVKSNGAVWPKWKAPVGNVSVIVLKASMIDGEEDLKPRA